jgi:hypothetical protein
VKTWWDYNDEIEALKEERAAVWRSVMPEDPHTVAIPKEHRQRMHDEAKRTFETQARIAKMTEKRREHYAVFVSADDELTPELHDYLAHMHYATFLAREADNHPSVTEIDSRMRSLREEQLAVCEEPDYSVEPARPGLRDRDDWRQ